MQVETVQVDDGNGSYRIINARDFDPKVHKKFGEAAAQKKAKAEPVVAEASAPQGTLFPNKRKRTRA